MALRGGSCGGTRPASLLAVLVLAQAAAAFQLSAAPSPARFVGASPRARARSARGALPALAANAASATGDRVRLAGGLEVSPLGVGAWAWGDRLFWGYDDSQEAAAQQAFNLRIACKPLRQLGQLGRHAGCTCAVALLLKLLARRVQPLPIADKALGSQRRIGAHGGFVLHGTHGFLAAPANGLCN